MQPLRFISSAALAGALLLAPASQSLAQSYPSKPIRVIVAYAPGGSTDLAARLIADEVMQAQGWRIVIDNRAGGGTLIGTETVARATPDGYTLFYGTNARKSGSDSKFDRVAEIRV